MLTIYRSTVVVGLAAVLASCSGGGGGAPTTPPVTPVLTTISLTGGTTVAVGSTITLIASPRDQNGNAIAATVTWSSGATSVAAVSSSGLVAGVAAGSANITASSGGVNGTAAITVTAAAVFPSNVDVNATTSNTFTPSTIDIARNGTVNWIFASVTHNVNFGGTGPANIGNTANATVSRTFTVAGTFNYQCTIHGGMTGQVIVH